MNSASREKRALALFVVACVSVWLVPTVAAFGFWQVSEYLQRDSVSAPRPTVVDVGERLDAEQREVVVDVYLGPPRKVASGTAGVVTALHAAVGSDLTDGSAVISVGGSTIFALAQDSPLYRPLVFGDEGPDVASLSAFLSNSGYLASDSADDSFGPRVAGAVREFQRINGYAVDGVFRPSYVVFVGPDFSVARITTEVGRKLEPDAEVMEGRAPVTQIKISDPELKALPPFSGSPLLLKIAGTSVPLSSTSSTGAAATELARALESSAATSTTLEAPRILRYASARLSLETPSKWGTVPSSALYVTSAGDHCAFSPQGDPIQIGSPRASTGQLGVTLVDPMMIGLPVVADVADLADDILDRCG